MSGSFVCFGIDNQIICINTSKHSNSLLSFALATISQPNKYICSRSNFENQHTVCFFSDTSSKEVVTYVSTSNLLFPATVKLLAFYTGQSPVKKEIDGIQVRDIFCKFCFCRGDKKLLNLRAKKLL